MTEVCRVPLLNGRDVPSMRCIIQDGCAIFQVNTDMPIYDSLCSYPKCRRPVGQSRYGCKARMRHCDQHAENARIQAKRNYIEKREKLARGLCAKHGCMKARSPHKRNSSKLGRYCEEHAKVANDRAKAFYKENKSRSALSHNVEGQG